jgi:hypothetical protein
VASFFWLKFSFIVFAATEWTSGSRCAREDTSAEVLQRTKQARQDPVLLTRLPWNRLTLWHRWLPSRQRCTACQKMKMNSRTWIPTSSSTSFTRSLTLCIQMTRIMLPMLPGGVYRSQAALQCLLAFAQRTTRDNTSLSRVHARFALCSIKDLVIHSTPDQRANQDAIGSYEGQLACMERPFEQSTGNRTGPVWAP